MTAAGSAALAQGQSQSTGKDNSTVIRRSPTAPAEPGQGATAVRLVALLTQHGARIDRGLIWRIYEATPVQGRHKLVQTLRDSDSRVRLPPGDYVVNVALGRANMTRLVTVKRGDEQEEVFVLNAGGLVVTAVLANGEALPDKNAGYDIYLDERDQSGDRVKLVGDVKLGTVLRLNAGVYHIVSTYGDANAVERSTVSVEAGKLTQAVVRHVAGRVTLRLVARLGGEALADTKWSLLTPQGEVVKETLGALPTHILRAGTYSAVARHGDGTYRQDFTVGAGESKQVEVLMK
jgi:hypothetical protein